MRYLVDRSVDWPVRIVQADQRHEDHRRDQKDRADRVIKADALAQPGSRRRASHWASLAVGSCGRTPLLRSELGTVRNVLVISPAAGDCGSLEIAGPALR